MTATMISTQTYQDYPVRTTVRSTRVSYYPSTPKVAPTALSEIDAPPSYYQTNYSPVKPTQSKARKVRPADRKNQPLKEISLSSNRIDTNSRAIARTSNPPSSFLPIAIPQATASKIHQFDSPFARAYAPQLASYGINEPEFTKFIDGLNEAWVPCPVYKVIGAAGGVCTFVPSAIAHGVGLTLALTSGFASAGTSILRTKAYMKKANRNIFAPRGLRAKTYSTEDMLKMLPVGSVAPYNNANGNFVSLSPTQELMLSSTDGQDEEKDPRKRRLQALEGRVAPLDWNVSPHQMPDNWMHKMGAWQAQRTDAKMVKTIYRRDEKRIVKDLETVRSHQVLGSTKQVHKLEKDLRKAQKKNRNAPKKEQKATKQIRWLVIVPLSDEEDTTEEEDQEGWSSVAEAA